MSQASNASGFANAAARTGISFLARIAGIWKNVPESLVEFSTRRTAHKTANYTVLAGESGTLFDNLGATATITFTLPPAVEGLRYTFRVVATSGTTWQVRVDPDGTETLENTAVPRVEQSAGAYLWADSKGEFLEIVCIETGKWSVLNHLGTWTAV